MLNDHLTNDKIQKVVKTNLVNNDGPYVWTKINMIKMEHNSKYLLTNGWFDKKLS